MPAYRGVAVIGEQIMDLVADDGDSGPSGLRLRGLPGGGPANTAVMLARLGAPVRFVGRMSPTALGRRLRGRLETAGVATDTCETAAGKPALALADLDEHGTAEYTFYLDDAVDWGWTRDSRLDLRVADVACLHTGSLALVRPPGGPLIEELLDRSRVERVISVDPNVRLGVAGDRETMRTALDRWARLADVLRASVDDVRAVYGDADLDQVIDDWHAAGVTLAVVTLGADGALASLRGTRTRVPGVPVSVVDSIGAGDAFTAGLLAALSTAGELRPGLRSLTEAAAREAVETAVRVGSAACTWPGANPPEGIDPTSPITMAPLSRNHAGSGSPE